MNKSELITKFLEKGILLSPKLLEEADEEKLNSLLPSYETNTLVLAPAQGPELSFEIKKTEEKKAFLVKDLVDYHNKKYNTLKTILSAKLNPVSINKLASIEGKATIIGLVSEKTPAGFLVEDPTGKILVVFNQPLPIASVLGFTGELKNNSFFTDFVSFPDIPLGKKIKTTTFSISFKTENTKPKILVNKEKTIENFPTPTTIKIKKEQELTVLVFRPEPPFNKNQAIEALKTRLLPETKIPTENYIIEEEPDVFWITQKDEWTENYKGVKIISGENAETV